MIINKVRLQEEHPMTSPSDSWPLPICDLNLDITSGENGYILKNWEGLGPPELVSVVEGFDSTGIPIFTSVPEKRIIVLKLAFEPSPHQSYGQLRASLYKYISRTIFVQLMKDSLLIAQTSGFIRNMEPDHFSSKPGMIITIECQDGDFVGPLSIGIPLATLDVAQPIINYVDGDAPTGLDFQFTVDADTSGFTISNHSEFWHAGSGDVNNEFVVDFPFLDNDVVTMSTHPKNKRLTLLRSSVTSDLAGYINAGAVWPKLYSGVNSFAWTLHGSWMTFNNASYMPRYWGV